MKVMVILCCILWFCTSCTFDFDEPGVCPYNVRLNYRYAGRPDAGQLSMYVDNIHQFLFDADGVLKDIRLLKGDSLEYWQGELAPGRYTLVAWGNWGYESDVVPAPQPGVTQIRELAMTSATGTATETSISEYRPNTERLYYGYSTFEIPATGNSVNRTVYLTHCHAVLRITVHWEDGYYPAEGTGGYTFRLRGVPCEYGFPAGYDIPLASGDGAFTFPSIGSPVIWHQAKAAMNYNDELTGELVTYRLTSGSHPLLSIYRGNERIMKEIDLQLFFRKLPVSLDENTEQEFDLLVTIGQKIVVTQLNSSDWAEGGGLG